MIGSERREAFRFFVEQAGYATPPGRAVCALELARAEALLREAVELGAASVEWVEDLEPLDSDDTVTIAMLDDGSLVGPAGCIVQVGDAERSLWGIVLIAPSASGDDPYMRVVEAELASELLDELRQAVGDARDASLCLDTL